MKIFNTRNGILVEYARNGSPANGGPAQLYHAPTDHWDELINWDNLHDELRDELNHLKPLAQTRIAPEDLLAPVGQQEVWAAGVTYLRSRDARMEESRQSGAVPGGASAFYDQVYDAERPELFFKSTASRVVGPGRPVRIRRDSVWNVPEPELTLFINRAGQIAGYTIGNDMSSRSIEGENPLYLPQAKTYDGSAALGPCLCVLAQPLPADTQIHLNIHRQGQLVFSDSIGIDRMKRSHAELAAYLLRENSFRQGCYLMTGTGIVPADDFTLQVGDVVEISIDGIGTLTNPVAA
jgi:2-dehydro-3-deoxy-D-arabinonate dehydratase